MASIYDVNPNELNEKVAEELKKIPEIKPPQWAKYVKTGVHKQRPPIEPDWWFMRTAAILRSISRLGPVGVSKLRTKYGGKKDRGHKPEHFYKGSGSIIRKSCQQLEAAGLIKQTQVGVHKGRVVTPKGQSLLDRIATQILGKPVKSPKPVAEEKKEVSEDKKLSDTKAEKKVEEKAKVSKEKPKVEKKVEPKKEEAPAPKVEDKPEVKPGPVTNKPAPVAEEVAPEPKAEKIKAEVEKVEELQEKGTLRDSKKETDKVPSAHDLAAEKKKKANE